MDFYHLKSCLKMIRIAPALIAGILLILPPNLALAPACGGPHVYEIDVPMQSFDYLLNDLINKWDEEWYEVMPKEQFLFIYPFRLEKPKTQEIELLWGIIYKRGNSPIPPPLHYEFTAALERGDLKTAGSEAKKIVHQVLDMPSVSADLYQQELSRALEFLELQPFLKDLDPLLVGKMLSTNTSTLNLKTLPLQIHDALAVRKLDRETVDEILRSNPKHPRTPTLRFVSLQEKFKREIPNGWPSEIRKKVPSSTWRELERLADIWLKDYPQHPLADLVRLWKNRIYYFEGRPEAAWKNLLNVYPKHLHRVLFEMRYLLYQSEAPGDLVDSLTDPLLITAIVPSVEVTPDRWRRWWESSERNILKPWAPNLQERLLAKAIELASPGKLPEGFPKAPQNPTALWGKLRALALIKAEKWDAAKEQVFSLATDDEQALLAVTFHIRRNDLLEGAKVVGLTADIRRYLIRVLIDDEKLQALKLTQNKMIQEEATFVEGVRLAYVGQWNKAVTLIEKTDPFHASLWRKTDALSRDKSASGLLKFARFLKEKNGKLFYGIDNAWYRSLDSRYTTVTGTSPKVRQPGEDEESARFKRERDPWLLPWSADYERDAIIRHLTGSSEMWLALQVYVTWLESAKPSPQMRTVVKEADVCYNWLVNWDSNNSRFWRQYLENHPVVSKLLDAGKRAKGR